MADNAPAAPLGKILESLGPETAFDRMAPTDWDGKIRDVSLVASFNWLANPEVSITIPGLSPFLGQANFSNRIANSCQGCRPDGRPSTDLQC